jgi:ribonucleoside-triphosphate reductase
MSVTRCPKCNERAVIVKHKTSGDEYWVCHDCQVTVGRVTEVYSRCCGYLRPVAQWNKGKRQEWTERKTYTIEKANKHIQAESKKK